jgi:glycosyltransferase involved in cell wall biosynthesis
VTIEIACATFNGARYLPEFLASLRGQSHSDWRLWVHDDGSTDETTELLRAAATDDPRIRVDDLPAARAGAARAFATALEGIPGDAAYIAFADQDDVWLTDKLTRCLQALRAAEGAYGAHTPLLVHTDLKVVDDQLSPLHGSFWQYAGFDPEPVTTRRLVTSNVATGATVLFNRALRERATPIPPDAAMHDWWCALTAAAFGHVVALRTPTVLYRQHEANAIGARDRTGTLTRLPALLVRSLRTGDEFRRDLAQAARQAAAFLDRFEPVLPETDRAFLRAYAAIPSRGLVGRKLDVLRLRRLPEQSVWTTLAAVIRA